MFQHNPTDLTPLHTELLMQFAACNMTATKGLKDVYELLMENLYQSHGTSPAVSPGSNSVTYRRQVNASRVNNS